MLIMLIVSAVIIIIKHWFKFSRKFYLIIIPAVFLCLLAYSVVYFGTLDLTDFLIAHRIIGDTNSTHYARQLASNDFKNMLEKYYVEYREENFYVILDNKKLTESQFHLERPHDPDATNSKTCIQQVTNQKREQFKFRP